MAKKIVIALGGNALGNDCLKQLELVKETASCIVDLVEEGYQVIIGHGNGPQVGMINLAFDHAYNANLTSNMPFAECGAMSQGYIGYHLQQAITNQLKQRKLNQQCVSLITQVEVDKNDLAFKKPSKPIGNFYSKQQADQLTKEKAWVFVEDAGRGYRRVVASPKPLKIVELDTIKKLIKQDTIVITVGGGGIPVYENNSVYQGVDAVIDKDLSCAKLAKDLDVDLFVILTAVDKVCLNFNKPNQQELSEINFNDALKYIEEGHFAKGSMLPKIEACLTFIKDNKQSKALITSLKNAKEALKGQTGTIIKH